MSATGLPPFATFADGGTGTGTLSLAPGGADAGKACTDDDDIKVFFGHKR